MRDHQGAPADVVDRLRTICLALPDAYEEQAWVGTRWMVRKKTFAHVLTVEDGWPPAYAAVAGSDGPLTLLTFRSTGEELEALRAVGPPFVVARWGRDVVGLPLDERTDWAEVAELLTESYCLLAPQKLVRLVSRPPTD